MSSTRRPSEDTVTDSFRSQEATRSASPVMLPSQAELPIMTKTTPRGKDENEMSSAAMGGALEETGLKSSELSPGSWDSALADAMAELLLPSVCDERKMGASRSMNGKQAAAHPGLVISKSPNFVRLVGGFA